MKTAHKWIALMILLGAIATAISGCQTAEGFGEDMEDAGESIQEKID